MRMTRRMALYDGRLMKARAWLTTCARTNAVSTSAESRWTYRNGAVGYDQFGHRTTARSDTSATAPNHDHSPRFNDRLAFARETRRYTEGLIAAISAPRTSTRVEARSNPLAAIRLTANTATNGPAQAHVSVSATSSIPAAWSSATRALPNRA